MAATTSFNTEQWNQNSLTLIDSPLSRLHRKAMIGLSGFARLVPERGRKILDLGCGSGAFLRHFYQDGYRQLFGVEPDPELIKHIPSDKATVKVGFAEKLDFPDASFDAVWIYGVLHHLKGLDRYAQGMDEVARVLKPGGLVFVLEPGQWDMYRCLELTSEFLSPFSKTFRALKQALDEEQPDVHFFIKNHAFIREKLLEKGFAPLVDRTFIYSWLFTARKP